MGTDHHLHNPESEAYYGNTEDFGHAYPAQKKTPTLKNYWPPKKSDNWDVLGLNKDFGHALKLGLVQQALA